MTSLEVIVTSDCPGCGEAHRLVTEAQRRFPSLTVDIIDLTHEPDRQPPNVFAVPTYLVDHRVVSLGTPAEADLFGAIAEAMANDPARDTPLGRPQEDI